MKRNYRMKLVNNNNNNIILIIIIVIILKKQFKGHNYIGLGVGSVSH